MSFFLNQSILSIFIASLLSFIISFFFSRKMPNIKKFMLGILIVTLLVVLIFTQGRAGWLGFIVALIYIFHQKVKNSKTQKYILYISPFFFSLLLLVLFFYKTNSSNGRLLIYKVSATLLKNNWLKGIGIGNFKVNYNEQQAHYFSTHSIDSKEALLADNTFYAFNDIFQFVLETGIIGAVLLVVFFSVFFSAIKRAQSNNKNKVIVDASIASLICIFIGSLFSYPLHSFPIIMHLLICLSIIFYYSTPKLLLPSNIIYPLFKTLMISVSLLLITYACFYINYRLKSKAAVDLKNLGCIKTSLNIYELLNNSYLMNGNTKYLYAQVLYHTNQLPKAKKVLTEAKKLYITNEVYKLSADIEYELANYKQAEQDYKTAIFMVPNRMATRKKLLDFYLQQKDTIHAVYWANSIIKMPVKVHSNITESIQKKTKFILEIISK